jgi:hypothetical protein
MPFALHPLIEHDLPYQPMHGNRHGLAKKRLPEAMAQAVMQGCWVPSLSHVDNIKTYFINNTCYLNMRFYNISKLYKVQLVRYFEGRHCHIEVMALSIMNQQRAIVGNVLRCHLAPSMRRRGALASLCHSPCLSLFSILLSSAPAHFWLVVVSPLFHRKPSKTMM